MKKVTMISALAVSALGLCATALAAMPGPGPRPMEGPKTRAEVVDRVSAHFDAMDANDDGYLTKDEMRKGRQEMRRQKGAERGGDRPPRDRGMTRLDADESGTVSREEAMAPAAQRFAAMDTNNDGQLSADEMKAGRDQRGDKKGDGKRRRGDRMTGMDADGDGKISKLEMTAAATKRFDKADANGDGTVTTEERDAMRKAWMEKRNAD
ncbi:hypothetical protein [Parvularcula sp. LCG005]|uniref:hypothetical protein n=1 Tax=Parvularcula sp. LCG005 TaxID=3078805 RepID=UPI002941C2F7|nr:hypothetical protein [Parvularcula sp. LCG005]WOI54055.1 hypothetical protein RUI03_03395 [Parvularcula sp. LCG005]